MAEGRREPWQQPPPSMLVKQEGSNYVTRDANGDIHYCNIDAQTALQTAFDVGGRIFISGPTTYNTTSSMTVPSNTHIEVHVGSLIKGAGSHPLLKNAGAGCAPGNSYIIVEGGTWDGNTTSDAQPESTTANLHFDFVGFVWIHRVSSINSQSECIKIRNATNAYVTECYTNHARLGPTGIGKAGVNDCV